MAVAGPILMYAHCLDELKGWPDESALDYDAKLSKNVTVDPVYGGSVVHVNAVGEFELGCAGTDMAIFLLQGSHELDVSNYGGTEWYPVAPTGKMSGLVATGAFELETTEFWETAGSPINNITPGMQLISPKESRLIAPADKIYAGKLFSTVPAMMTGGDGTGTGTGAVVTGEHDTVCAVASRVSHINHHNVKVVSFWPVYCPYYP